MTRLEAISRAVELRPVILKAVQVAIDANVIRVREQAELFIECASADYVTLGQVFDCLHELYSAALIILTDGGESVTTTVLVKKSDNVRCERCRLYRDNSKVNKFFSPTEPICGRCVTMMVNS